MRDKDGKFAKGYSASEKTQFKKGQHWREEKPCWDKEWLEIEYITKSRSAADIAAEMGITEAGVLHWLKKHNIPRRTMQEIRKKKYWGASGVDNPMWNKKDELNPNWQGGVTPERQTFYTSEEWKNACSFVWKRDKATCQRCGLYTKAQPDMPFHIHHIEPFANKEMRADADNLVLLCEACHHFVHSKRNINREHLPKK